MMTSNGQPMTTRTEFYFNNVGWQDRVDFWIQQISVEGGTARRAVATNVQMAAIEEGMEAAPLMSLTHDQAQQIMDALYRCGLRPTAAPNDASVVPALRYHLDDMRKIAARFMNVEL